MQKQGIAELVDSEESEMEIKQEIEQAFENIKLEELVKETDKETDEKEWEITSVTYSSEIKTKEYKEPIESGKYVQRYEFEQKEDENSASVTTQVNDDEAREAYEEQVKEKIKAQMYDLTLPILSKTPEEQEKIKNYSASIGAWSFVLYDIAKTKF